MRKLSSIQFNTSSVILGEPDGIQGARSDPRDTRRKAALLTPKDKASPTWKGIVPQQYTRPRFLLLVDNEDGDIRAYFYSEGNHLSNT